MIKRGALVSAMHRRLRARGLYVQDAFRVFDHDGNGVLSCSEFFSACRWLGLKMLPADVHEIVRQIDEDGDGLISPEDWLAWMKDVAEEDAAAAAEADSDPRASEAAPDLGAISVAQSQIEELGEVPAPRESDRSSRKKKGWFGFG